MFSKQESYSVASSQNVVRIKLSDTTTVDFNLLNETASVSQSVKRAFFGLTYQNKYGHIRWINVAENIRKQLDRDSMSGA
jgi:hypothetical protein